MQTFPLAPHFEPHGVFALLHDKHLFLTHAFPLLHPLKVLHLVPRSPPPGGVLPPPPPPGGLVPPPGGVLLLFEFLQLSKPNSFIQSTPVTLAINLTIPKDIKIKISPIIDQVIVFLAPSVLFGSPPEVINLIPPNIIKITATIPAKRISHVTRLVKIMGTQSRVKIFSPPEVSKTHKL